jgi:fatty acid-binding protein DegV
MGNLIGVKPIIYMDANGTMTNIGKERGRMSATKRLIQYYEELNDEMYEHTVIIGHSDALDLAKQLGEMLLTKYPDLKIEYAVVNPTAGSHCGPECIGIAFYAKHK